MPPSNDAFALLAIAGNVGEIAGIAGGLPLLVLSFIPSASGLKGYSLKLAGLGLAMAVVGLAFPGIINMLEESLQNGVSVGSVLATIATVIAGLLLVGSGLLALATPGIIATREQKEKKVAIIVCNCFAFLPMFWLIAFIWACIPEKRSSEASGSK